MTTVDTAGLNLPFSKCDLRRQVTSPDQNTAIYCMAKAFRILNDRLTSIARDPMVVSESH